MSISKKFTSYEKGEIVEVDKSKIQRKIRIFLRSKSYLYNLLDNTLYSLKSNKNVKKENKNDDKEKQQPSLPWNTINYLDLKTYIWVKEKWSSHLNNLLEFKNYAQVHTLQLFLIKHLYIIHSGHFQDIILVINAVENILEDTGFDLEKGLASSTAEAIFK